jgi:hypothetical protein
MLARWLIFEPRLFQPPSRLAAIIPFSGQAYSARTTPSNHPEFNFVITSTVSIWPSSSLVERKKFLFVIQIG